MFHNINMGIFTYHTKGYCLLSFGAIIGLRNSNSRRQYYV